MIVNDFDGLIMVYCLVCGRPAGKVDGATLCGEGHRVKVWSIEGPLANFKRDGKETQTSPSTESWRKLPPML